MHPSNAPLRPLGPTARQALASRLGDTPETVISVHLLRRGLARAFVSGDLADPIAAIIQADELPTEPAGFGEDATALWALLRRIDGWTCVNVSRSCARTLGDLISQERKTNIRLVGDVYHTLHQPVISFHHDAVRLLSPGDRPLLEAAPAAVRGGGFGSIEAMLADGITAGAVIDGILVAIAGTYARTAHHADLGVTTLEPWRGHGFATAAASLVCAELQRHGIRPVWSAGERNGASLRIARKLGFTEVGRRTYVIPDQARP
ncbi:MAG: GNAT family N-acetyltransferase [Thermomicrobiales bacterium]